MYVISQLWIAAFTVSLQVLLTKLQFHVSSDVMQIQNQSKHLLSLTLLLLKWHGKCVIQIPQNENPQMSAVWNDFISLWNSGSLTVQILYAPFFPCLAVLCALNAVLELEFWFCSPLISLIAAQDPCSPSPCSPFAECKVLGSRSYECTCKEGFQGDGKICQPINPCVDNNGGCPENSTVCLYRRPGEVGSEKWPGEKFFTWTDECVVTSALLTSGFAKGNQRALL